jgi:hypothetical protein
MHSQRDMTAHIMSIIKEQIFLDWQWIKDPDGKSMRVWFM